MAPRREVPSSPAMKATVMAAAAAAAKKKPSEDRLKMVRDKMAEARQLELDIEDLQEQLKDKSEQLNRIRMADLPGMFGDLGISDLTLEPSGNLPGYAAEVDTYFSASFPEKPEEQEKAVKKMPWLAELTKNRFTVDLGKGDEKKAKLLRTALNKQKIEYSNKVSVHASTLKAEIRRRTKDGKPLTPDQLKLISGYVGKIVNLTQTKKD